MNLRRAKFVAAFVVVGVLVVFGITFTASPTPKSLSAAANKEESVVTKEKKILVVCYSFSCGNTRKIAKQLQVALNADYAEIEPVTPYPPYGGWDSEVTRQGKREVEAGYQPEIKPLTVNVADYDVIAVGTPTLVVSDGTAHAHISALAGLDGEDRYSLYDPRRLAGSCDSGHQDNLRRGKVCSRHGNTV